LGSGSGTGSASNAAIGSGWGATIGSASGGAVTMTGGIVSGSGCGPTGGAAVSLMDDRSIRRRSSASSASALLARFEA
jgi:hypothetical protein